MSTIQAAYGADRARIEAETSRAYVQLWRKVSAWLAEPGDRSQAHRQLNEIAELCRVIRENRARLSH